LNGGLSLLPPFGMHDSHFGDYNGCMEALSAVRSYIERIKQNNVILFRGDLAINLDLKEVFEAHLSSGCEITAACSENPSCSSKDGIRFVPYSPTTTKRILFPGSENKNALNSMEIYVIKKSLLISLIDWSRANGKLHFHRDALAHYLRCGGTIGLYIHNGYSAHIRSIADYYKANMDMLKYSCRKDLFPDDNPVYTKGRSSVSTYYADTASATNSLVADGCYIEGKLVNCVLFRGVQVKKGATLKNCVILQDSVIGENASLSYVIADKYSVFSDGLVLSGNEGLPITVPKGKLI